MEHPHASPPPPITLRVQQLAGWAFLNCAQLEEVLKAVLSIMATLQAGKLTTADAKPILDGTRKLTAGVVYKEILAHLDSAENWPEYVERALAARNQIIHGYKFSRWDRIRSPDELNRLESELQPQVAQIQQGVGIVKVLMKGFLHMLIENYPELKTAEWDRVAASEPHVQVETTAVYSPPD